jgi:acyl-CoA reductase-like NAD-dependent aldehyde dehydrogenase
MELSGCDAAFVRADADLERVTKALRFACRLNHGETCIAPHRVFVHQSVAQDLQNRLETMGKELEDYPIRTRAARAAAGLVEQATKQGARVLAGKILPDQQGITPTVLTDVRIDMALMQADLFAPVIAVVPVQSDEEAVRLASQCPYALGATVFGGEKAARALADKIQAGGVTINDAIAPTADPRLPFGGRARSGFGVTRGGEGLLDVTTVKVVSIRHGGLTWHLDSPHPSDAEFFDTYIRATNASSWRGWIRSWFALTRIMIRRLRGS